MERKRDFTTLEDLVNQIETDVQNKNEVSLDTILQVVGRRSFGTLFCICGIITLAPIIGDIPGLPTVIGIIVFLTSIQLLIQRENIWLPQFLLKRSIKREKLQNALKN
jgi:hypothetical protein